MMFGSSTKMFMMMQHAVMRQGQRERENERRDNIHSSVSIVAAGRKKQQINTRMVVLELRNFWSHDWRRTLRSFFTLTCCCLLLYPLLNSCMQLYCCCVS